MVAAISAAWLDELVLDQLSNPDSLFALHNSELSLHTDVFQRPVIVAVLFPLAYHFLLLWDRNEDIIQVANKRHS